MNQLTLFKDLGEAIQRNIPLYSDQDYIAAINKIEGLKKENSLYKHKYAGKCSRATKKTTK
jgi:hypothetical protein